MSFSLIIFLTTILVAIGQLANTIFVPAIDPIAKSLHVIPSTIQGFFAAYLLPYGISQFIYGPLSDRYGRKIVTLYGMIIFFAGTLFSAFGFAYSFVFCGFILMGIGAGVGGMMCRTIMRDCFSGDKLHKANSIMTMAIVFAPIFAPIIGGTIVVSLNWRTIFLFLTLFSIVVFALQFKYLKETRPTGLPKKSLLSTYSVLFYDKSFLPYLLCLVFTFGGITVFEASLGVLLGGVFKLEPQVIGLLFILPCPFFLIGSYSAGRLSTYYKLNSILLCGIFLAVFSSLIMLVLGFIGSLNVIAVMFPLCFYMMAAGLICPTATTGALDPLGDIAGTAGASLGGFQNLGAGFFTLLSSFILQTTQRPLSIFLTLLSIMSLLVYLILIKNGGFSHMEKRFTTEFEF